MSSAVEAVQRVREEAYEKYEYIRMRTDEITDASERLPLPMRNHFEYDLNLDDGELYFQGQRLREVFETGLLAAEKLVESNPRFIVELIRRRLELEEYRAMQELALGREGDSDLMVVLSPIPDAVADGRVDLGAYDRKRMKTMLRVFRRTDTGIEATSVSLDLSDREGIQRIAVEFGVDIPLEATSEQVLGMRLRGSADEFSADYVSDIARMYDSVLEERYGGAWSGGRQGEHMLDAQGYILAQQDLLSDHMARMQMLGKSGAGDEAVARARYDFAAALARRLRGDSDAATLEEAGDTARANNEEYNNDCPTGSSMTSSESLERLGYAKREWKHGSCRNCKDVFNPQKIVGECDVCKYCEHADNEGMLERTAKRAEEMLRLQQQNQDKMDTSARTSQQEILKDRTNPASDIKQMFGEMAVLKTVLTFGGADKVVFDRYTNEELGRL